MQSHSESEWDSIDDQGEECTLMGEAQTTRASAAFTNASHFTINNSSFVIQHSNSSPNTAYYRKKPKLSRGINKRKNLEFNSTTIPKHHIDTYEVICSRKGSRFYAARRTSGSSATALDVVVQQFEGSTGKQQWEKTLRRIPHSLNPYLLQLVGISPPSVSDGDPHYIVYKGACKLNPRRLIASLLGERDRERLAGVGSQVVYGITSALDYLSKAGTALCLGDIGGEVSIPYISGPDFTEYTLSQNFDVFSDENGRTVVCFTAESPHTTRPEAKESDVEVCNAFITKLFSGANHILHREKLLRIDDDIIDEALEAKSRQLSDSRATGKSKVVEDTCEKPTPNSHDDECRQEITWRFRNFDTTLSEMSESYGDLLNLRLPIGRVGDSNAIALPRRSGKRRSEVQHECRGYRREEITLTPDAFRNQILVFKNPSANERCGVCGEIVQFQSNQESDQYLVPPVLPNGYSADYTGYPQVFYPTPNWATTLLPGPPPVLPNGDPTDYMGYPQFPDPTPSWTTTPLPGSPFSAQSELRFDDDDFDQQSSTGFGLFSSTGSSSAPGYDPAEYDNPTGNSLLMFNDNDYLSSYHQGPHGDYPPPGSSNGSQNEGIRSRASSVSSNHWRQPSAQSEFRFDDDFDQQSSTGFGLFSSTGSSSAPGYDPADYDNPTGNSLLMFNDNNYLSSYLQGPYGDSPSPGSSNGSQNEVSSPSISPVLLICPLLSPSREYLIILELRDPNLSQNLRHNRLNLLLLTSLDDEVPTISAPECRDGSTGPSLRIVPATPVYGGRGVINEGGSEDASTPFSFSISGLFAADV
ncbi:hypothetical protein GYMLUDRAFT_257496 [Collybiopsis luxurians FD-317 M1]|nr:hypothetical protein GYMLUDRAFT_257496 [Collybiopsis luxurians FD-317 M1]